MRFDFPYEKQYAGGRMINAQPPSQRHNPVDKQSSGSLKPSIPAIIQRKGIRQKKFDFKTFELAFVVREIVYQKIIKFDVNSDMQFQEQEIKEFLITILNENENEIHYFIKNVFRYDYNNDGIIEYDELVNFCMEQHLGEIAIQRLHRQKLYSRGSQRLMSRDEFIHTIKYALSFIHYDPPTEHLQLAFSAVDADLDGYISYEDYFRFLKEYFGSKSYAAGLVNTNTVIQQIRQERGEGNDPNAKKELDIVKKYSKYENIKIPPGSFKKGDIIPPKQPPINNSTSSIANSNITNGTIGNSNITNNNSKDNINTSNSNIINTQRNSNIGDGNGNAANSNIGKNSEGQNTQEADKKRRPSQNSKIELTLLQKLNIGKETKIEVHMTAEQTKIGERIARLVYSQLKPLLMDWDSNKDCRLTFEQVWNYLKAVIKVSQNIQADICKRHSLLREKEYTFEEVLKFSILQHINKVFKELDFQDISKDISIVEFTNLFEKVCSLAQNTPLHGKYQNLYKLRVEKSTGFSIADAHAIITFIFSSYTFKK